MMMHKNTRKALMTAAALLLCLAFCTVALAANYVAADLTAGDMVTAGDTIELDNSDGNYDVIEYRTTSGAVAETQANLGDAQETTNVPDPAACGGTHWEFVSVTEQVELLSDIGDAVLVEKYVFEIYPPQADDDDDDFMCRVEYLGDGRFQINIKEPPLYIEIDGNAVEFTFENGVITIKDMPQGAYRMLLKWATSTVGIGFPHALY